MERRIRIKKLITWGAIALAALIAYALFVHFTGLAIPCLFHTVTRLNCPGCGISRFGISVLQLKWSEAIRYNYMAPLIVIYVAYVIVSASVCYIRTGLWKVTPKPAWLNWVFLALLLIWSIFRNIFGI